MERLENGQCEQNTKSLLFGAVAIIYSLSITKRNTLCKARLHKSPEISYCVNVQFGLIQCIDSAWKPELADHIVSVTHRQRYILSSIALTELNKWLPFDRCR